MSGQINHAVNSIAVSQESMRSVNTVKRAGERAFCPSNKITRRNETSQESPVPSPAEGCHAVRHAHLTVTVTVTVTIEEA